MIGGYGSPRDHQFFKDLFETGSINDFSGRYLAEIVHPLVDPLLQLLLPGSLVALHIRAADQADQRPPLSRAFPTPLAPTAHTNTAHNI